jgi:L-lactate utilization protein LutC
MSLEHTLMLAKKQSETVKLFVSVVRVLDDIGERLKTYQHSKEPKELERAINKLCKDFQVDVVMTFKDGEKYERPT